MLETRISAWETHIPVTAVSYAFIVLSHDQLLVATIFIASGIAESFEGVQTFRTR